MGSDLPLRETFISTRGPSRSKGATSAACVRRAPAPSAASIKTIATFLKVLAWEAENTPASLFRPGVLNFLFRRFHRAFDYSASRNYAKNFCCRFFENEK